MYHRIEHLAFQTVLPLALGFLSIGLVGACGGEPGDHHHDDGSLKDIMAVRKALFTNGSFEDGVRAPRILNVNKNNGLPQDPTTNPPQSIADLNLGGGGTDLTVLDNGPQMTLVPWGLDATCSLRVPFVGSYSACVNIESSATWGHGANVNRIKQADVITNADVDPSDGLIHVRYALAPVLQNPNHGPQQQPYFFAILTNVTKGTGDIAECCGSSGEKVAYLSG